MSDTPAWFDDDLDTTRRPRRHLVLVLAIVATVWVVLAVVLVRGGSSGAGDQATSPAAADDAVGAAPAEDGTEGPAAPPATTATAEAAEAAEPDAAEASRATNEQEVAHPVGHEEAEALALVVVRGWLSDAGPDLPIPGVDVDRRAYLEHAVVERIEVPTADLAVARVLLVLLVREDDRYTDAIVRRAAVPLTLGESSVHPAGPPWWLASQPDLAPVPPETTPVEEAEAQLAVVAALEASGYEQVELAELGVTSGGTLVATVTARTADGDPLDGPVWLHPTPDGPVLLGAPPAGDPPAGDPP